MSFFMWAVLNCGRVLAPTSGNTLEVKTFGKEETVPKYDCREFMWSDLWVFHPLHIYQGGFSPNILYFILLHVNLHSVRNTNHNNIVSEFTFQINIFFHISHVYIVKWNVEKYINSTIFFHIPVSYIFQYSTIVLNNVGETLWKQVELSWATLEFSFTSPKKS